MFDYVFYLIENKKGDIEIEESDMLELASDYEVCLVQFIGRQTYHMNYISS